MQPREGLVGRENELALLRRAVDAAVDGRARTVLIGGEPGIGKTALAEEAASHATDAGALALWGACWEGEGAPAFWPWIQVIRAYARGRSTDELYSAMADGAADIARLVPEIGGRFLALTPDGDTDPEQARFRLFDNVSRFLAAAAEAQPLVLVFDDLHWADRSSLMLLSFFAQATRTAPVAVIGTYRDAELPRDHLLDIPGERIALGGLAREDVTALIRETIDAEPPAELAAAVFGRSSGNPLFVKEIARLLDAQGRLDAHGTFAIPEGVRDVVRRRLAHLPQDAVALLAAASVAGPEFDVDFLVRLVERPQDVVLRELDAAVEARLLTEPPGSVGRFAFAHALVRDALYGDLGAARRAGLHWRAGELLSDRGANLPEIAHHFIQGAAAGDAPRAVAAALRAARSAMSMYAWDQGADLYTRALDVMRLGEVDDALRVRTMLELGDALIRSGDLAAGRAIFGQAADLAAGLGMASELAHAALGLGGGLGGFEVPLFDQRQMELLHRALEQLPDEDSAVRAWVLARLSVASSFTVPAADRASLSRDAIAMARRLGDRGALSYALSSLCDALAGPDDVGDRIAASSEMIDLAARPATGAARCGVDSCAVCLCDPEFALLGRRLRIVANLERGDVDAVDRDIDAYARLADHLRQPLYLWYTPLFRGMRAIMRGELDEADRHLEVSSEIAARTSSENASTLVAVQRAGVAFERDDLAAAEQQWRMMFDATEGLRRVPSSGGIDAMVAGLFGDPADATSAFRRWIGAGGLTGRPKDAEWLASAAYAAESAVRARDVEAARHLFDALAPYESSFIVDGIGARFMGSGSHYLGLLARLLERRDDAERYLKHAVEAHRAAGAVLWEARSREALGDTSEPGKPATVDGAVFRREGEYWTVAYGGAVARMRDSKGLRDIAVLLASPGREFASLDLVGAAREGDAGEILDERARDAYKRRIAELQAEIDDDPAGATRAREELDALTEQLAGAYGLGGRARRAGDPAERARKAVTERIRDAVAKVSREHPALGRHLKASIKTGTFCSYAPEHPPTWSF